jgi:RNA polymerase sigma factor (sigma-70 family)
MGMGKDPFARPDALIRRVYAYVAYRVGPGPDAEDLTSDVFERALRYRESYDPARGEPLAWLIGIARRCVEGGRPAREEPGEPDELPDDASLEEDAVRRLTLVSAVATLGGRDQELIALRYGADLTARQIGALLELETNAVEVALHRALERLRAVLEESPDKRAVAREHSRAKAV